MEQQHKVVPWLRVFCKTCVEEAPSIAPERHIAHRSLGNSHHARLYDTPLLPLHNPHRTRPYSTFVGVGNYLRLIGLGYNILFAHRHASSRVNTYT